jgi:hypothetical protein
MMATIEIIQIALLSFAAVLIFGTMWTVTE